MEKQKETNWLRKIVDFLHHVDQIENLDLKNIVKITLSNLQVLSSASKVLLIEKQDKVTVSVTYSLPDPVPVSYIEPSLFDHIQNKLPIYLKDNFPAELQTLTQNAASVVLLPLPDSDPAGCVLMIWSEDLEFNEDFKEFIYISFSVMRRVVRLAASFFHVEQLELHFNTIMQTVPQSIVFIDDVGRKSWLNDNAAKLFGLPSGDIEPSVLSVAMQSFRNRADNKEEIYERGMDFFKSGKKTVGEWKWIYSSPRKLVLNVYCTPTVSANVNGVLWMFEDITEKYFADKQIQDLNTQLQKASDYKSQFLANMSHELRTPLNSIIVLANLLKENESGNLNEKQQNHAAIIENSGNDLLYLINDILDLSKIEAGKMDILYNHESISEIARSMTDLFTVVSRTKNIDFELYIADDCPDKIITDRHRLNQIIKNLLSNAFKFTPAGGKVKLAFTKAEADDFLKIEVSDTGIGVEKEKQEEIFEAFKQANGSTSRNYGGTGLGLSISKELVWKFGGRIYMESKPNRGSKFSVELPIVAEQQEFHYIKNIQEPEITEEEDNDRDFSVLKDKKILLVSDDIREIFKLSAALDRFGLPCQHAMSYDDFESMFREQEFDILTVDLAFENYKGLEILRLIRQSHPEMALISLISAEDNHVLTPSDMTLSMQKPVKATELLERITDLLQLNH